MNKVNINFNSRNSYELFHISFDRSGEILDRISSICGAAMSDPKQYAKHYVQEDGKMPWSLNIPKMLEEMLEIATTEDEKNFVLYTCYTGIEKVQKLLDAIYKPI